MEHDSYDDVLHILDDLRQAAHKHTTRPVPDYLSFLIETKELSTYHDKSLLMAIALLESKYESIMQSDQAIGKATEEGTDAFLGYKLRAGTRPPSMRYFVNALTIVSEISILSDSPLPIVYGPITSLDVKPSDKFMLEDELLTS